MASDEVMEEAAAALEASGQPLTYETRRVQCGGSTRHIGQFLRQRRARTASPPVAITQGKRGQSPHSARMGHTAAPAGRAEPGPRGGLAAERRARLEVTRIQEYPTGEPCAKGPPL